MSGWLLRAYPPAWRERYGEELASLIESEAGGGRIRWRVKLDVVGAGLAQRLRSSGLAGDEAPPELRIRAGVLLVLSAWAAFVVAGLGFAKTAEHWQAVTPRPDRGVPSGAYDGVLFAAELGTLAVGLGIALTARPLLAFLRAGGWRKIHRPVLRALGVTGLTFAVLLGVIDWAHGLTDAQRNGGDLFYGAAFVVLVGCGVTSIALWTRAAIVTAKQLTLARVVLGRETVLAAATTVTMAVMTIGATTWWMSVDRSAPAFFGGTALPVRMLAMSLVMSVATVLAATGTSRSVRALRA